jgi:acetoin:2,6-dichlorophenolindophenol oxidoreductase subunit beta
MRTPAISESANKAVSSVSEMSFREAIRDALMDAMAADERVVSIGEDIAAAGGVFKTTEGLFDRFGAERVRDTPISEQAIVGCALGAAATGLRPVAEIMFADFAGVCFDQIANQLAKHRYMTGGQVTLPVTLRFANGAGVGFAAQHSQSVENWFLNVPGLKICVPSTPADAYGLLRASIREDDPVLFFEHKALYSLRGVVDSSAACRLGEAAVRRGGLDLTIVASQQMAHRALDAAELLASRGVDAEVVDPRTLVPLDMETIASSVRKTSRLMVIQECPANGSWGSSLVARVASECFTDLDAAPVLISAEDTPIPFAESLESAWLPQVEAIVDGATRMISA